MSLIDSIKEAFAFKISNLGFNSGEFLLNLLIAILLIIIGIFLGKLAKYLIRKIMDSIKLKKIASPSFINLFLIVIKWSIYVLFINLALIQLNIPTITSWLTTILGVIPALTGALIIISVGFAIASYLKKVIADSKVEGWEMLSYIFFYFIIYVFLILALKTALISIKDAFLSNVLVAILSLIAGFGLIVHLSQKKKD